MKKRKLNPVQREAKILLTKSIIKNWDKATEQEKKEIEKWWKETYGEFKEKTINGKVNSRGN